jgi:hypothetical protein
MWGARILKLGCPHERDFQRYHYCEDVHKTAYELNQWEVNYRYSESESGRFEGYGSICH